MVVAKPVSMPVYLNQQYRELIVFLNQPIFQINLYLNIYFYICNSKPSLSNLSGEVSAEEERSLKAML